MAAKEQTESEKRVGSIKRSVRYKDIREDLNDQLEHSGNSSKYTIDLVEDYMNLWITKQLKEHKTVLRYERITLKKYSSDDRCEQKTQKKCAE